jgi:hypothetical protein
MKLQGLLVRKIVRAIFRQTSSEWLLSAVTSCGRPLDGPGGAQVWSRISHLRDAYQHRTLGGFALPLCLAVELARMGWLGPTLQRLTQTSVWQCETLSAPI